MCSVCDPKSFPCLLPPPRLDSQKRTMWEQGRAGRLQTAVSDALGGGGYVQLLELNSGVGNEAEIKRQMDRQRLSS